MTSQTPIEITTAFLDACARGEVSAALANIDDDIAYTNVSLPTIHGKRRVAKVAAAMGTSWFGFDYRMVNVAADGPVVLTERIDELRFGPLVIQFWVWGRFEISEGRIAVWRDSFDYFDMSKGLVRGLVALLLPRVQQPLAQLA